VLALHPSRPAHAESLLAEAVLEGATNGFIRTFADEGAPLAQYFQQWREREYLPQGIERHYLESLIQAAEQSRAASSSPFNTLNVSKSSGSSFNPRERELLQALAEGRRNRELA